MATIINGRQVTDEQISMAHRFVDLNNHRVIYMVESASEAGTEYRVFFNPIRKSLECSCKAAAQGLGCWHRRAAVAAAQEYRQELIERNERDMAELQAEIDAEARAYTIVEDETSSSLDGQKWEMRNGKNIPMR